MANNFTTTILVNESPKNVFNAINNVRGWWQGEFEGTAEKLNEEFSYRMETFHFSRQKVVELIPDRKIVWLVTESDLSFLKQRSEWTGTTISFEITETDNGTQVLFTHHGLLPDVECYEACSSGWTGLIQKSLVSFITSGKGKKVF